MENLDVAEGCRTESGDRSVNERDGEGRRFYHLYHNQVKFVIAVGKHNMVYRGFLNIARRTGESKFGDEFIIQVAKAVLEDTYEKNTEENHIEIYLKAEEAIPIFQKWVDTFGSIKREKKKTRDITGE